MQQEGHMTDSFLSDNEHYRLLVENITDYAIITLDTNGIIRSWNNGAQKLLQYKAEEAIGKDGSIFFTENDVASGAYEKELIHAREHGRAEDERWHVRQDGTTFWGSGIMSSIWNPEHTRLLGFAKIFRDRTERFAHERRKDEFVGIAGHELRTPLSILKMGIELLIMKTEKKDPETSKELKRMDEHIDRLAHIITDLLDLSKIASGRLDPQCETFEVSSLIANEVLPYYRSITRGHTLTLIRQESAEVWADKDQIIQVLYNLIGNAVKYSPHSDKVELGIERRDTDVKISLRDFGVGISDAERERIFQRFYRVNNRRQTASGMGVGLYICKEIVKAHGGVMGFDTTDGPGTTIYFTLPLPAAR